MLLYLMEDLLIPLQSSHLEVAARMELVVRGKCLLPCLLPQCLHPRAFQAAWKPQRTWRLPGTQRTTMRRRRKKKVFGLETMGGVSNIVDPLDYEQKYAPDPINEETAPNARVWRMCADEFAILDGDLSEDARDTVDVLLVFAGLFSAVVTTFLVQVSTQLQPDYVQLSSSIMYELLVVQRMIGNGSSVDINPIVPSPDAPFHPAREVVWVNGLWYTSLSLSLVTALVASLAKQWLHQYMAMSSGSARERCLIRQYRCDGYYQWGIPFIIGALPVLLHMSLGLFFAGLTVYLVQLYFPLAILACSLAG
ncbi:hypothetical protein CPB85DRAFT_1540814 [Mucidula mucida]|nr:hypothetical protein CPB85DRAFT_1540814 [Mucidula mucida]